MTIPTETRTRSNSRSLRANTDSGIVRLNVLPRTRYSISSPAAERRERIPDLPATTLIAKFVDACEELDALRHGRPVVVDGKTISLASIVAAARFPGEAQITLDSSPLVKQRVDNSAAALQDKVTRGVSIYGVSTGFGGSADTRTDRPMVLGQSLLEMQHCGILPSPSYTSGVSSNLSVLPLSDPFSTTCMPESWVRGAILIRMNSLVRGHSGVRWELIERMGVLLEKNITPLVPMRGSISASGDLSPLSYIAGAVIGNPSIRVFYTPPSPSPSLSLPSSNLSSNLYPSIHQRQIVPSSKAFKHLSATPLPSLFPKEHLGILNGTSFSCSVGALAMMESVQMILGGIVCTALGTEAMAGSRGNYASFLHKEARPHAGQVESGALISYLLEDSPFAIPLANDDEQEGELHISKDGGKLKQDRYPLRTAPQFLGPQVEDALHSWDAIVLEANSTTDNPLVQVTQALPGYTPKAKIHNGGNFQAMAITNAMEKTRLSLHHVGKLLFAQSAELVDPKANRGLPPNLALGDPSLDYCMKGVDISSAAYVSELGYLANPVSTHIQSAEMHNQAVNSLALISARQTMNSLETLGLLMASYLYNVCQGLDLRAMQKDLEKGAERIISEELASSFSSEDMSLEDVASITAKMYRAASDSLDKSSTLDVTPRMQKVAKDTASVVVDWALAQSTRDASFGFTPLVKLPVFTSQLATRLETLLLDLRLAYVKGEKSAEKSLGRTRPVYDWIRGSGEECLNVKMRPWPGYSDDTETIGESLSRIYESIRDGGFQKVIVKLFSGKV